MKLISTNVGLPRDVEWQGEIVTTGIFKDPVDGPLRLGRLNLEGDKQADLTVHGGVTKAVYGYPVEHYAYWREQLPGEDLPYGSFGENFTTEGLFEDALDIGDLFGIGTAKVMVSEPRLPCYKLGVRFGRQDMPRRFMKSMKMGFYFKVIEEGDVQAGDAFELLERSGSGLTIVDVVRLYTTERKNVELLEKAVETEALSDSWREYFREQLVSLLL